MLSCNMKYIILNIIYLPHLFSDVAKAFVFSGQFEGFAEERVERFPRRTGKSQVVRTHGERRNVNLKREKKGEGMSSTNSQRMPQREPGQRERAKIE